MNNTNNTKTTCNQSNDSHSENRVKINTIQGKPVIMRSNARTVLNMKSEKFAEKLLCDGITKLAIGSTNS